jgi:hypothetical protein
MNTLMTKKLSVFLLIGLFILSAAGCAKPKVDKPKGFAEVETGMFSGPVYKAVSPEGMLYKVRTVKNYPSMELGFWGDSLKNQLIKEGYHLTGEEMDLNTEGSEGVLFEWILPYGNDDYIYMTAVLLSGSRIIIAESAAEHTVYKKYRGSILDSLKTVSLRLF